MSPLTTLSLSTLPWWTMILSSMAYPMLLTVALASFLAGSAFHIAGPRRGRWVLCLSMLPFAPVLALAILYGAGQTLPAQPPPRPAQTAFRVAHLNTLFYNDDPAPKLAFARASQADVISLVEVNAGLRAAADGLKDLYPYRMASDRTLPDNFLPTLLLSRWPVGLIKAWNGRIALYRIDRPGRPFYVLQAHTRAPSYAVELANRDATLRALAAAPLPQPLIAVGDFNTVPWDPALAPLREQLALAGSWLPTFPNRIPLTPIDLLLATPTIAKPALHRIRVAATDHLGLVADFTSF